MFSYEVKGLLFSVICWLSVFSYEVKGYFFQLYVGRLCLVMR